MLRSVLNLLPDLAAIFLAVILAAGGVALLFLPEELKRLENHRKARVIIASVLLTVGIVFGVGGVISNSAQKHEEQVAARADRRAAEGERSALENQAAKFRERNVQFCDAAVFMFGRQPCCGLSSGLAVCSRRLRQQLEIRVVERNFCEQRAAVHQQISVQTPTLARPRHLARPDIQPVILLLMQMQFFEVLQRVPRRPDQVAYDNSSTINPRGSC